MSDCLAESENLGKKYVPLFFYKKMIRVHPFVIKHSRQCSVLFVLAAPCSSGKCPDITMDERFHRKPSAPCFCERLQVQQKKPGNVYFPVGGRYSHKKQYFGDD